MRVRVRGGVRVRVRVRVREDDVVAGNPLQAHSIPAMMAKLATQGKRVLHRSKGKERKYLGLGVG